MRFGVQQRIVNKSSDLVFLNAGVEVPSTGLLTDGDVTHVKIAEILIPDTVTAVKAASAAGTKGVYTITIDGSATATGRNTISLEIEIGTLRNQAEYSRYAWLFGKRIHFPVDVAASASATVIADALVASINKRIARYNDLPFTVDAVSDADIVVTFTELDLKVLSVGINAADKDGKQVIGTTLVEDTAPVSPVGQGSQVEETVQMLTGKNALAGALLADDRVDMAATYTQYRVALPFTDGVKALPAQVGEEGMSGSVDVLFWIKDGAMTANQITDLEAILA